MKEDKYPAKKLSKAVLDLKFMKKSKEKALLQEENEERQELYQDQLSSLHEGADKIVMVNSYVDCLHFLPCRLSFGGMDIDVEKLNEDRLTGLYKVAKPQPKEEVTMMDADVTVEEMAARYRPATQKQKPSLSHVVKYEDGQQQQQEEEEVAEEGEEQEDEEAPNEPTNSTQPEEPKRSKLRPIYRSEAERGRGGRFQRRGRGGKGRGEGRGGRRGRGGGGGNFRGRGGGWGDFKGNMGGNDHSWEGGQGGRGTRHEHPTKEEFGESRTQMWHRGGRPGGKRGFEGSHYPHQNQNQRHQHQHKKMKSEPHQQQQHKTKSEPQ